MNIFERIRIQGFRRLQDVNLKLQPLNVLIGANGSGKTSLLEVFSLLANSAAGKLNATLNDMGGIDGNLTNLLSAKEGKSRSLAFELAKGLSDENSLEYRIAITPQGIGYTISEETLAHVGADGNPTQHPIYAHRDKGLVAGSLSPFQELLAPSLGSGPKESALSQIPKTLREPEDFREHLASLTHYHVLDVSSRAPIRLPQPLRDANLPGHDGEDIVSCLYNIRETETHRFETIEATLRAGFPNFERLNFPPVAAGTLAMTWKDKTSKYPFYMHQLSEGTLRFLWLVTLLQCPGLTDVTMIDEPEVSLHPELLALLAELLREASQRTQLIVATHADRLIRFLKPAEVVTINMNDDGAAEFTRADELDLDKWLEEYTLDEVWRLGRMGGRS